MIYICMAINIYINIYIYNIYIMHTYIICVACRRYTYTCIHVIYVECVMSCVMYDIQVGLRLLLIVVNRIYIYVRKVHHMSREKHCTMCGGKCIRYAQILFIFYQHLCFLTVLYMYSTVQFL